MAINSIPASRIVSVLPSVLSAGGQAIELSTMLLTTVGNQTPTTGVMQFGSADEVRDYFGSSSEVYSFAVAYFNGYRGATKIPSTLWVADYLTQDSSAVMVGASMRGVALNDIKVTGNFEVIIDGSLLSVPANLTAVTSFAQAATVIDTALDTDGDCTFDAVAQRFIVKSAATGAASTIAAGTGIVSSALGLTDAKGAQSTNGRVIANFTDLFTLITNETQNFGVVTTLDEQVEATKKELAAFNTQQNSRYLFVIQDTAAAALIPNNPASFGSWLNETEQNGTMPYYGAMQNIAALCGGIAAIDFKRQNGRRNIMFMSQDGLIADVTSNSQYTALISNSYTFYGAFATATARFVFQTHGEVSGEFAWADNYLNQIRFNSQLQLAMMTMLTTFSSLPYNEETKAIHRSAAQDPINEMLNFGGIVALVDPNALSEQQKAALRQAAGEDIVPNLLSKGWAMKIWTADAQARAGRASMPFNIWYTDGGSVQSVAIASINVQ